MALGLREAVMVWAYPEALGFCARCLLGSVLFASLKDLKVFLKTVGAAIDLQSSGQTPGLTKSPTAAAQKS